MNVIRPLILNLTDYFYLALSDTVISATASEFIRISNNAFMSSHLGGVLIQSLHVDDFLPQCGACFPQN